MYGIFTYIYHNFKPNVDKYSIHGAYGIFNKIICWVPGIRFAEVSHVEQGRHPHTFPCHLNIQIHYSRCSNPLVVTPRGAIANRLTDFLIKLFSWELTYSLPAGTFWRCCFLISEGWEISVPLEGTLGEKMGPIHQVSLPFFGGGFLMQDPFNVEALFLLDQSDTYWMLTTATCAQKCWAFANATRPKTDRVTKNPHSWPSFSGSMFVVQSLYAVFLISFEYQVMYCGCTLACIQALSICLSGRYSCYTVDCVDIHVAFFTHNTIHSSLDKVFPEFWEVMDFSRSTICCQGGCDWPVTWMPQEVSKWLVSEL